MRKNLSFSCRDLWVPIHRCMGKGEIHYIEVAIGNVDGEKEEHESGSTSSEEESAQEEEKPPRIPLTLVGTHPPVVPQPPEQANRPRLEKGGVIATPSSVLRYDTLYIRGTIQGKWETALIYGGATYNFIDALLVSRWALRTEEFEGFDVVVENGHTLEFLERVP